MTTTYRQVKVPAGQLEREAGSTSHEELRQVLTEVRQKIRAYGLTPEQLFGDELSVHVRFRDPTTGKSWNGSGRPPNWIRGQDRNRFRVE